MEIYLASGNAHKLDEFRAAFAGYGQQVYFHSANEAGGMPEVEETGDHFEDNALLKAQALVSLLPDSAWALADDSGLIVDALGGAPGVHSARYAGPGADAGANNLKLLQALEGVPQTHRSARFRCVLCLVSAEDGPHFFAGNCEGEILTEIRGTNGFGYDPLFVPLGFEDSFAEMSMGEKQQLSHRGVALQRLKAFLQRCLQG